MKRTFWYAAMTKDEAQHSRMTFYEAVGFVAIIVKLISFKPINPAAAHIMPKYGMTATLIRSVPAAAPIRSAENSLVTEELLSPVSFNAAGN